uniref:A disintegrin and metalloproteinase with thrombospondin motifs adt-1-like n=1 Tax=Styela clava TaxID=7725 RepID=UPI00193A1570|nr:A disintegrin and metalloproteinase with thrombospondin motifs adt-1-like [Styela clava]
MTSTLLIFGAFAVFITTVFCNNTSQTNVIVQWSTDVNESSIVGSLTDTVKKSSRSNIENAVVLTREQENEIVKRHNHLRTIVRPTAKKMRKMTWDDELATIATRYSRKCIYEHNKQRKHSRFEYIGENLYISTGILMDTNLVTNAVSAWDNEKVDYDYESRTCKPGKKCGHYTQTAWDDTFKVGCGVTICKKVEVNGRIWKSATLFNCNYGPGGNYPRHPFAAGRSCTDCDKGDVCEDNLCTNTIRDQDSDGSSASWNEWSPWSTCSKTCIGGMATRERTCNTFVAGDCEGAAREMTYSCSQNLCGLGPKWPSGNDDQFLPWGGWSECSTTCGVGLMVRTRKCKNPRSCNGINKLSQTCHQECPAPERGWTQWGRWQDCSVTCGRGVQKKKRSCSAGSRCPGRKEQTRSCAPGPCETVARWSDWSEWSVCSKTCGGGSTTKTRRCLTGRNCEGATETTDVCNTNRCPGVFSSWSKWSDCSKTCGSGIMTRSRSCIGGRDCRGPRNEGQRCNVESCPIYGKWSSWGPCDVTCGSGNRIRTRVCSSSNDDDCDGENTDAMICSTPTCTTSGWSPWSPWGKCSVSCGGGQKTSTRICNVGNSGPKSCIGDTNRIRSCRMQKCPELSNWSSWSSCDATCDEGTKSRSRICENGPGCVGGTVDTIICKMTECTKSRWDKWTEWTSCSTTCGEGSKSRKRVCITGNEGPPCVGENNAVTRCELKQCQDKTNEKDPANERGKDSSSAGQDEKGDGGACGVLPSKIQIMLFSTITFLLYSSFG